MKQITRVQWPGFAGARRQVSHTVLQAAPPPPQGLTWVVSIQRKKADFTSVAQDRRPSGGCGAGSCDPNCLLQQNPSLSTGPQGQRGPRMGPGLLAAEVAFRDEQVSAFIHLSHLKARSPTQCWARQHYK